MMRSRITAALEKSIRNRFGGIAIPKISVEVPEISAHGDYTTNAAMIIAPVTKKNPREIAAVLAEELKQQLSDLQSIEIAGPGFLNIRIYDAVWHKALTEILKKKTAYGKGVKKKEKIQLEFISANPTGPLTLANGRGGFFGDVLARVLEHQGYGVEREYYINDAGNQIRTLGLSVLAAARVIQDAETYYHGPHIDQWAKQHRAQIEKAKEKGAEALGRQVAQDFFKKFIRPAIEKKMKIRFDRWTSEYKDIRGGGYVEKVLAFFKGKKLVYEKEGAQWLTTTAYGDDKDRVLVTGDGFPTYFLVDAGHYLETKQRKFAGKINVLGADHHGYVSRIQAVARIVGIEKSEIIVMQLVRLISGGQEVRMSKRRGNFVTVDELIDEVGTDAARFFFLEKSPGTHLDFNLDLAKEKSQKNPVFYVQYAHARMASIFRKARSKGKSKFNSELLKEKEELMLIKKIAQLPEIIADTAMDYQVHRLPRYALELARTFHNFYEKHWVIGDDKALTQARLALVKATQQVLQQTLSLLGVSAPEKM